MTLTVTNAWNQHGWDPNDHLIDDGDLSGMVGRAYPNLAALKRDAQAFADKRAYPTVEYHDGYRRYLYDGSPSSIPGRHMQIVTDLGPLEQGDV